MAIDWKDIEVRITADGSTTLYRKDLDETYHSTHGALQEARHVFIENGLKLFSSDSEIRVLEIGLGTGLNALLSLLYSIENRKHVFYDALEAYPLPEVIWTQVNYNQLLDNPKSLHYFNLLHQYEWNVLQDWSDHFKIRKINTCLEDFSPELDLYDVIYFDAFGPRAQEEMWHAEHLKKLYDSLKTNGFLVTYCAKGSFKRDLKALGFVVRSVAGPPGKREMTQAWKQKDHA